MADNGITISNNTKGNPYHKSSNGQFTRKDGQDGSVGAGKMDSTNDYNYPQALQNKINKLPPNMTKHKMSDRYKKEMARKGGDFHSLDEKDKRFEVDRFFNQRLLNERIFPKLEKDNVPGFATLFKLGMARVDDERIDVYGADYFVKGPDGLPSMLYGLDTKVNNFKSEGLTFTPDKVKKILSGEMLTKFHLVCKIGTSGGKELDLTKYDDIYDREQQILLSSNGKKHLSDEVDVAGVWLIKTNEMMSHCFGPDTMNVISGLEQEVMNRTIFGDVRFRRGRYEYTNPKTGGKVVFKLRKNGSLSIVVPFSNFVDSETRKKKAGSGIFSTAYLDLRR